MVFLQGIIVPSPPAQAWRAFDCLESSLDLRLCQLRDNACAVYRFIPKDAKRLGLNRQELRLEASRLAWKLSLPLQAVIYWEYDEVCGPKLWIFVQGQFDAQYEPDTPSWIDGAGKPLPRGPLRALGPDGALRRDRMPVFHADEDEHDDPEPPALRALSLDETMGREFEDAFRWHLQGWLAEKKSGEPAACGPWSPALGQVFRAALSSVPPEMLFIALDRPEDPNGWLIVADWLEERGQSWEAARCRDCSQMADVVSQEAWLGRWRSKLNKRIAKRQR